MSTTLQNILTTLKAATIVRSDSTPIPTKNINYGITDGLIPPYIAVTDFKQTHEYNVCRVAFRNSTFHVVVFHYDQDEGEVIAAQVIALLDNNRNLTPTSQGCFLELYEVGQIIQGQNSEELYQFACDMTWSLKESG